MKWEIRLLFGWGILDSLFTSYLSEKFFHDLLWNMECYRKRKEECRIFFDNLPQECKILELQNSVSFTQFYQIVTFVL